MHIYVTSTNYICCEIRNLFIENCFIFGFLLLYNSFIISGYVQTECFVFTKGAHYLRGSSISKLTKLLTDLYNTLTLNSMHFLKLLDSKIWSR